MVNIYNLFCDIDHFLNKVKYFLAQKQIHFDDLNPDHICYRVDNLERYHMWKYEIKPISNTYNETKINGRPISVFRLKKPIIYEKKKIYVVELPAPKIIGEKYTEGFEHVEFVIDSFGNFFNQHPRVVFDNTNINRPVNPWISLQFEGFSVKFHLKSLEKIILEEQV